jgi:hypothetical protein
MFYRRQAELDPKFISIDCSDEFGDMLPPDDIFAKIVKEVESLKCSENVGSKAAALRKQDIK